MNPPNQKAPLINSIRDVCSKIVKMDSGQIVRKQELGPRSLVELEDPFNIVRSTCSKLLECDLILSIQNQLEALNTALNSFISQIGNQNRNTLENLVNDQRRNSVIQEFKVYSETVVVKSYPILVNDLLNKTEQNHFNIIAEQISKKLDESQSAYNEIVNVLESSKTTAGKIGVSSYAKIFEEESENHKSSAKYWLLATIIIIIVIISNTVYFLNNPHSFEKPSEVVQYSISKVILFSILFYALALCSKSYRANKHNQIVNKHRQNALNSFETFSQAGSSDPQTQHAVLLAATNTIFSSQQTGYITDDKEGDNLKVMEIFKNMPSAAK